MVTGGTGLLGSHLLLRLVREGGPIRAIFRDPRSTEKVRHVFSYYSKDPESLFKRIEWVKADLNDLQALETAFRQVRQVYHCAALISFDPADFGLLNKVNAEGTANIVNLCIDNQVEKLCYASSVATVGRPAESHLADEEDFGPDRYPNVYALSKQSAEKEVWRGSQEGLPVAIVNPGIILGPGYWESGSGIVFGMGAKGRPFAPPGGTGFVSAADVAQIMVSLMQSSIRDERFITVAGNMTYRELLTQVAKACRLPGPRYTIPGWLLQLLWRLDWLRCRLVGSRRKLTKSAVVSLLNPVGYNNHKIKEAIGFKFEPLEKTLEFCCRLWLKEKGN